MSTGLAPAAVSRHKCLIYDGDPSDQLPVVIPLLLDGLQDNWRCLYLGSPEMVSMVGGALRARGVDVPYETQRGALLMSSARDHLDRGKFDPRAMIDSLSALIDDAVQDGFQGLCATGDMRWELGEDDNFDRLLEYEARLEQVFRDKPLRGICQYHRDVLPARAVREALVAHQSVYIGSTLNRDNLYYMPPELLLDALEDGHFNGSKQGEWMCQQIMRVLTAEESRDKALSALQESEARQRRLAEQLAEMNWELERRVAERTAELRLANEHLEAFSYSVSQDLRSPLGTIIGSCEMLENDCGNALGEQGRKHLDRMGSSAWRMRDLIDGLLTLARVAKTDPSQHTTVDLSALAEEVAHEIRQTEPQRSVELVIHKNLHAAGDPTLLRAVLVNLVSNAWKFTSKRTGARIEVSEIRGEFGGTAFFVKDNGAGFDMKSAENFSASFKDSTARTSSPAQAWALQRCKESSPSTAAASGRKAIPAKAQRFFSLCLALLPENSWPLCHPEPGRVVCERR